MLGSPNEDEKSFITDENAISYIDSFKKQTKLEFEKRFPNIPVKGLDFLS